MADINAGCGQCEDCVKRDGHHCAERTVLGIVGRPGAFAERTAVPERCLVEVADSLADDRAVFAEPYGAALHVLDELESEPRDARAVVLGDGKLGLLIALSLHAAGREADSARLALRTALTDPSASVRVEAGGALLALGDAAAALPVLTGRTAK